MSRYSPKASDSIIPYLTDTTSSTRDVISRSGYLETPLKKRYIELIWQLAVYERI